MQCPTTCRSDPATRPNRPKGLKVFKLLVSQSLPENHRIIRPSPDKPQGTGCIILFSPYRRQCYIFFFCSSLNLFSFSDFRSEFRSTFFLQSYKTNPFCPLNIRLCEVNPLPYVDNVYDSGVAAVPHYVRSGEIIPVLQLAPSVTPFIAQSVDEAIEGTPTDPTGALTKLTSRRIARLG